MRYAKLDDNELFSMVCESNEDAREDLYKRYKTHIGFLIKKYSRIAYKLGIDISELESEASIGFAEAMNRYDIDKDASLKTFISMCVEGRIINYLKKCESKGKKGKKTLSLDYGYTDDDEDVTTFESYIGSYNNDPLTKYTEKEKVDELISELKMKLSYNEYEVFRLMKDGLTYQEVAKRLNKTPKQIDNARERIKLKIKDILKELEYEKTKND